MKASIPAQRVFSGPSWILLILLILLAMAGAGCRLTGFYLDNPANPFPDVRKIAVAPVESPGWRDPVELGEALASELVQFPGIEVVRPTEVNAAVRQHQLSLSDERSVRALGRIVNADAVLLAELTEYDPYHPPRIGMAAQLFFIHSNTANPRMAISLSSAGRARLVDRLDRGELIQIEKIYDGAQRETRDLAASYARGHSPSQEAIDGADRVLRLPDLYFRFVSNRLVRDLFADYQAQRPAEKQSAEI